ELTALPALAYGQAAIDFSVHATVALTVDIAEDKTVLAFFVLDQKRALLQADRRHSSFVKPSAVRIAVALEVNGARARFPLAVIGKAVGLTADEYDRDARVTV